VIQQQIEAIHRLWSPLSPSFKWWTQQQVFVWHLQYEIIKCYQVQCQMYHTGDDAHEDIFWQIRYRCYDSGTYR
jgi:hypothetical protein